MENVICKKNGEEVKAPKGYSGTLKCPDDIEEFCNFPVPCENYCSLKGYCVRKGGFR